MSDSTLDLPLDGSDNRLGFTLDAGASVIKIIYRSKDDYSKGTSKQPRDKLHLRLATLPRDDADALFSFINANCDVIPGEASADGLPAAYFTGVGVQHLHERLDETFTVRTKTLSEGDCSALAISSLICLLPQHEVFYTFEPSYFGPILTPIKDYAELILKARQLSGSALGDVSEDWKESTEANISLDDDPHALASSCTEREVSWPLVVVQVGSGASCVLLQEDGRFESLDMSQRGGRTLLGLAQLLVGCMDYNELADMASRGSSQKVDTMTEDLKAAHPAEVDLYSLMPPGLRLFSFGKVFDKNYNGTYSHEDIAACLVNMLMSDLVQFAHLNASQCQVKGVVFCGSFFNHPYMRATLHELMLTRCMMSPVATKDRTYFKVMRCSGYMGAIGSWMKAVQLSERKD